MAGHSVVSQFDRMGIYYSSEFHMKGVFLSILQGFKYMKNIKRSFLFLISHNRVYLPTLKFCVSIPCIIRCICQYFFSMNSHF